MKQDFILAESEISTAVNKITNMANFLVQSVDDYIAVLSKLQTDGINDNRICAEISELAALVKSNRASVQAVSDQLAGYINVGISEAESCDNFQFPSDFMTEVTSLLSRFIL